MTLSPRTEAMLSIVAYSTCSASTILVNKAILHYLPYPSLVITSQLVGAVFIVSTLKWFGKLDVDPIRREYLAPYLVYGVAFALGLHCNMMTLSTSTVETVIVFRALSPVVVSVLDALFLDREWPSSRSWGALSLIVLGAYWYACADETFQTQGFITYRWAFLYLFIISFIMSYGKMMLQDVDLKTKSGPILYTNLLSVVPTVLLATMGGEYHRMLDDVTDLGSWDVLFPPVCLALLLSACVVGTAVSYSSWWCRDNISAASFTLVGVMSKCLTILANSLIWDKHANAAGIASLMLCLVGGALYRQAPMRKTDAYEEGDEYHGTGLLHDMETGLKQKLSDEKMALKQSLFDVDRNELRKFVTWTQAEVSARAC